MTGAGVGGVTGAGVGGVTGAGVGVTGIAIGTAANGAPVGKEVDPDGAEAGADVGS